MVYPTYYSQFLRFLTNKKVMKNAKKYINQDQNHIEGIL